MLIISYLVSCTGLTSPPSAGLVSSSSSAFKQLQQSHSSAVLVAAKHWSCTHISRCCSSACYSSNCLGNAWDKLKDMNSMFSVALQIAFLMVCWS